MFPRLTAATDVLAIEVTIVATLVVVALVGAVIYMLRSVRELRREADGLARDAQELLDELGATVRQAGAEVERVGQMVGSAEAISDAVGSASRLVGGVVTEPLIKVVAFGSGIARAARVVRGGGRSNEIPALARENRRRRSQVAARPARGRATSVGRRSR